MKRLLLNILFLTFWVNLSAQEIKKTRDVGLWMGASIEYKFKDDYLLTFSQDLRLFESLREIDKYITDIGLEYKINKNFKLGGNVRYFLNKRSDKTISQDWRYNLDLKFKGKLSTKFKVKYRLRFQSNYKDLPAVIYEGVKSNLRNKIAINYDVNEYNLVYFSSELFREIVAYRKPYFNKMRLLVGDKVKTKLGEFDVSLGYERELNSQYPLNYFFARIYYTFKLKK